MLLFCSIVGFYGLILISGALSFPFVSLVLQQSHRSLSHEDARDFPLLSAVPAIAVGLSLFLLLFSNVARVLPNYFVSMCVSFVLLGLLSFVGTRLVRSHEKAHRSLPGSGVSLVKCFSGANVASLLLLFGVHAALWLVRLGFTDIHYDPNHFGAEKLFNLQLQQAFLFSTHYPPESPWLAGEPVNYYILPRILPGILANFIRVIDISPLAGGALFHLSDTFYHALACVSLLSAVWFFAGGSWRGRTASVLLGFLPLLSAPARAFYQTWTNQLDLWSLSRIIPNTVNEYPFWNFLWADNHAHSNAAFLQVSLAFWSLLAFVALLRSERVHALSAAVITGILAAAVYMSQSGSVMIDFTVLGTVGLVAAWWGRSLGKEFNWWAVPVCAAAVAAVLAGADILTRTQPQVTWSLVPPRLASSLLDYFNIHAVYASIFAVIVGTGLLGILFSHRVPKSLLVGGVGGLALVGLSFLLGYPLVGVASLCVILACVLVSATDENVTLRPLRLSAIIGSFSILIVPEIIAANFDMGGDSIRYNTVFKYLYDSFYLFPVMIGFALVGAVRSVVPRWVKHGILGVACVAVGVLGYVQFETWHNRITRVETTGGPTGYEFLATERPHDWAIIQFLAGLPGRVVVAEECGVPPKSGSFSVAGRMSAYSGRPALCGWGVHSFIHHRIFRHGPRAGQSVWAFLLMADENIRALYDASGGVPASVAPQQALSTLRAQGITHVVLGEWEKEKHPRASLDGLERLGGRIVFQQDGFGVVAL